jgi:hypothetical protein
MGSINSQLSQRLKTSKHSHKMTALAEKSAEGSLTSFSGLFGSQELQAAEKHLIENLLERYAPDDDPLRRSQDLSSLIALTSEVKAINNQAALLHGERIKKAQDILLHYQEGAFSSWLITTYGNRQTPYNFLLYYNFWLAVPSSLHPTVEKMPRQAVYSLSSRHGEAEKKIAVVENYKGETKSELLTIIREAFPLSADDKRKEEPGKCILKKLLFVKKKVQQRSLSITPKQKDAILSLLEEITGDVLSL